MTDTQWRLSGAVGEPAAPEDQVFTQGIGFPLRPVDGVPPPDTGEIFNSENVAQGNFMQWLPQGWEEGKYHTRGSVVSNGQFAMIASQLTLEYPYPAPDGNPTYGLPSFAPATQSSNSVVYSGHDYVVTESVWARRLRVWVTQLTPDTNYRLVSVIQRPTDTSPTTQVAEEPVLIAGAWTVVAALNSILPAGTTIRLYIDALNSGADQIVTCGWRYDGRSQTVPPLLSGWNHDNSNTLVRIDKTDLDDTDRSSELAGITPDSTLVFANTATPSVFNQYRVTGALTDQGTYFEYPVVLQEQGEGGLASGVTTTLTANIPIPQPTEYAEQAATVPTPTWATVQGYLAYDGVEQPAGVNNSYGIDIECEASINPTEWDVFSVSSL